LTQVLDAIARPIRVLSFLVPSTDLIPAYILIHLLSPCRTPCSSPNVSPPSSPKTPLRRSQPFSSSLQPASYSPAPAPSPPLPSAHKQHSPVPYGRSTNPPSRPSLPPRSIPSHISNQIPIREAQMLHSHLPRRQQITITILHPSPYSSHTA
jgi:hypothetical protein